MQCISSRVCQRIFFLWRYDADLQICQKRTARRGPVERLDVLRAEGRLLGEGVGQRPREQRHRLLARLVAPRERARSEKRASCTICQMRNLSYTQLYNACASRAGALRGLVRDGSRSAVYGRHSPESRTAVQAGNIAELTAAFSTGRGHNFIPACQTRRAAKLTLENDQRSGAPQNIFWNSGALAR